MGLRDGAWINTDTGGYAWLDHRGRFAELDLAAIALNLRLRTVKILGTIGPDMTATPYRVLLAASFDSGLVRVRLGEKVATFEFRIPVEKAVLGCREFLEEELGEGWTCRFNSLVTGQSHEFRVDKVLQHLQRGDASFLVPPRQRPRAEPPVPAPWLLLRDPEGQGHSLLPLSSELPLPALLDVVRKHLGPSGGWLGLPDGRRWWLDLEEPPLMPVGKDGVFAGYETCSECGWPRQGDVAPCKCWCWANCKVCGLPYWPVPMRESIGLDGQMRYVPHIAGYAHWCVDWPSMKVC